MPSGWVADDVTVTLTATDPDSGVDETRYEIDGTPTGSSPVYDPASKPVLHDGQTISYFSVDEVGNKSATKTSVAAKVDKAAPSVSDDVPAGWVANDVTVTLTASDPASGVHETRYAIDGTPNSSSPVYDPAAKPVLHDGQRISYVSVDEVGNASATKTSAAAQVDQSAPSVSDDVPDRAGDERRDRDPHGERSDVGRGQDPLRDRRHPDHSSPVYDPASKPVLHDGQTISYVSVDNVGNTERDEDLGRCPGGPHPYGVLLRTTGHHHRRPWTGDHGNEWARRHRRHWRARTRSTRGAETTWCAAGAATTPSTATPAATVSMVRAATTGSRAVPVRTASAAVTGTTS